MPVKFQKWMREYLESLNGMTLPALVDEAVERAADGDQDGVKSERQEWEAEQSKTQLKLRLDILTARLSQPPPEREPGLTAPALGVLVKLGSLAVHAEEALGSGGHAYDWVAVKSLLADPELQEWLKGMSARALLPVKRR